MTIAGLTLAIRHGKGIYVPLLASGVSRSANVPTGYEVMLDLIQQVALLEGVEGEHSWERWYEQRFGERATYSALLARLGPNPADRAVLLRRYFEPTEAEREQGVRVPTRAHRAIAALTKRGYFRVILTTNFDQLMERALSEAGVQPMVVSTPSQFAGMPPLHLGGVMLLKLNGDYLDLQTRNLPEELESYGAETERVLDRVLDEHGLVVCGWSADYDIALRRAIERCPTRRFASYWTHRSALTAQAERLVAFRGAVPIEIASADSLFESLRDGILALEARGVDDSQTTEVVLARLKLLMQDTTRYIDLEELLVDSARRASAAVQALAFSTERPEPNKDRAALRITDYERAVAPALPVLFTAGYWGRADHDDMLARAVRLLEAPPGPHAGSDFWAHLLDYPGALAFYAVGVGAVLRGRASTVAMLCRQTSRDLNGVVHTWPWAYNPWLANIEGFRGLDGLERARVPISERIYQVLAPLHKQAGVTQEAFADAFDEWELIVCLAYSDFSQQSRGDHVAPIGRFAYRHRHSGERGTVNRVSAAIKSQGSNWRYVAAGLFGGDVARAQSALSAMLQQPEMREV